MPSIETIVKDAVTLAVKNSQGSNAAYIPELASVPSEYTAIVVKKLDGSTTSANNMDNIPLTLQSTAKLIVLIGLLEDIGPEKVFKWVRVEPSGDDFASIARLDQFGPQPNNPMLNSGAISLCSRIPGKTPETRFAWIDSWTERLFGAKLRINPLVFASERRTGDRNRSLAYLLKSTNNLPGKVDEVLESYFYLCSLEASIDQAAHLPMLLANGGANHTDKQIFSTTTALQVISIMATCGLYNESGTHMLRTGLPAKSGVSGLILAVAPRYAGIAVASPRINAKGTSLRGSIMLEHLSSTLGWHFAKK